MPIPPNYKFDEVNTQISTVHNCISNIMNNYGVLITDFDNYRNVIMHEEERFVSDALAYFSRKVNAL